MSHQEGTSLQVPAKPIGFQARWGLSHTAHRQPVKTPAAAASGSGNTDSSPRTARTNPPIHAQDGLPRCAPILEFLKAFGEEERGNASSDRTGLADGAEAVDCSYPWHAQFGPFARETELHPHSTHTRRICARSRLLSLGSKSMVAVWTRFKCRKLAKIEIDRNKGSPSRFRRLAPISIAVLV